jgi:WD40 repeat protein/serine/threonine protein kinase
VKTGGEFERTSGRGLISVSVPDHELLRGIAEGSYGEVWLARNVMGAYRAVKFVHRSSFDHERPYEREMEGIQQFEPISRSHDGFVDVLQVGRNDRDGYFYYVMELGDDALSGQQIQPESYRPKTLAGEVALRGRLSVEECLRLSLSLSDALHHLHSHGLSHRDIKPSNIIFINGVPKLADIGLVAAMGPDQSYVGTEGYIPPEGPGTSQADIFALGKVLYEIGTGKDRYEFPELPDDFDRYTDAEAFREFNEVILKACHTDVKKRFASAREMNVELSLLLNGKSVRRLRLLERRWVLFKRVASVAALALAVTSGIAYPLMLEHKRAEEDRERRIGAAAADGFHAMDQGNMIGAFASFAETLRLTQGMKSREELERLRCDAALAQCPKIVQMWFDSNDIIYVDFHPDGRHVLISVNPTHARIWDVESGQFSSPLFLVPKIYSAVFSPDGHRLATADDNGLVQLWDPDSGVKLRTWKHDSGVMSVKYSPDGTQVLTGCMDKKVRLWSVESGALLWEFDGHSDGIISAVFSRDGRLILTGSRDFTARILEAQTGKEMGAPLRHPSWVYEGSFSPDGRHVVTGCFDRKARIWNVASGRFIPPVLNHGDGVNNAQYSPDGNSIVTACMDGTVRLWDSSTQLPTAINSVIRHSGRVMHATFNPEGNRIASGCVGGITRVWDISANKMRPQPVQKYFSPDCGRFLDVGSHPFRLWDTRLNAPCSPPLPVEGMKEAIFSPNGQWVLTICTNLDKTIELRSWATSDGTPAASGVLLTEKPEGVALGNDGVHLATFSQTNAQLWNVKAKKAISTPFSFDSAITRAVFSPDVNRLLLLVLKKVHIVDTMTGQEAHSPLVFPTEVSYAAYSPDGSRLVVCCSDGRLREWWAQIWDAQFEHPIGALLKHQDGVLHASFSPDGKRIATSGEDFAARVWDADTGAPLTPPMKHDDQVQTTAFSQDGRFLITASIDKSTRIWDAATGEPLTPPIRHPVMLWGARFFADPHYFLAESKGEPYPRLSALPQTSRPVNDLLALAHLLSGAQADNGKLTVVDSHSIGQYQESIWKELKTKYPADHTTTLAELQSWRQQQAEAAEKAAQWAAAVFHWNALAQMESENPAWAARRARAERYLADQPLP